MLYHKLLEMGRRHMPEIVPMIESATLFVADLSPHESLAKKWGAAKVADVSRTFRLPYQITAIEDRASLVILGDLNPRQRGLGTQRLFIECLPADAMTNGAAFADPIDERLMYREITAANEPGSVIVSYGVFLSPSQRETDFLVGGEVARAIAGTPSNLKLDWRDISPLTPAGLVAHTSAFKAAMTAVEEIVHVQGLPGFTGWPQDDEHTIRYGVFDIGGDGSITPSDRHSR